MAKLLVALGVAGILTLGIAFPLFGVILLGATFIILSHFSD